MDRPVRILVLGAAYGLLPGIKLALAGHAVTLVGRAEEIAAMARAPLEVSLPLRRADGHIVLAAEVAAAAAPGRPALRTPDSSSPADHDFVILAMQEPQYAAPEVTGLMGRIAEAGIPCLSIMNLAPPCYLDRLGTVPPQAYGAVYSSADVWARLSPDRFTLASPDAQAVRLDPGAPGRLTVTLPSNLKAAPFPRAEDQALLERLARDASHLKWETGEGAVRPPVMLRADHSLHAPLAKWPMLIAGNCRCLTGDGIRPIAEAVHGDLGETRAVYGLVAELLRRLGAREADIVSFDAYADAARQLTMPSSLARGLAAGAKRVERIDRLVLNLLRHYRLDTDPVERIGAQIDRRLN